MNLCKDCKHYRRGPYGIYSRCLALVEQGEEVDLVDGSVTPATYTFCIVARTPDAACGPDAKFFEPMPKRWWEFWK